MLPWDVPVRLVAAAGADLADADPGAAPGAHVDASAVRSHPVDLGLDLPGVDGVVAETMTCSGRTSLRAIRRLGPGDVPGDVPGERPIPLRDLLETLVVDGAVPVRFDGTPFARAVLTALLEVAPGERCTYAELAARAGRPAAVRAAAHVMATNRVPLVLPCHRIVPSSGGTGRYGWGDGAKRALLEAESSRTFDAGLSARRGR
jgi:O-6-methylguanine DNA methyltransferase